MDSDTNNHIWNLQNLCDWIRISLKPLWLDTNTYMHNCLIPFVSYVQKYILKIEQPLDIISCVFMHYACSYLYFST
jgi:hypothetical protein